MTDTYSNKVAVVTGAGSGIGRALAVGLAARGARLAISDVSGTSLDETARMIEAKGGIVHQDVLDVSDSAAFEAYGQAAVDHFGVVHQLYNNAGIAMRSELFTVATAQEFDRVMQINFDGVVTGTRVFLPHLIASGDGHMVTISSLNELMAQPLMTAYVASKFAVRGFTEAIRSEMIREGLPVEVTVVHPGGIATNIVAHRMHELETLPPEERPAAQKIIDVYQKKLLRMPPDVAAQQILDGQARGKRRIVLTARAKQVDWVIRLMPSRYVGMVATYTKKLFDPG